MGLRPVPNATLPQDKPWAELNAPTQVSFTSRGNQGAEEELHALLQFLRE